MEKENKSSISKEEAEKFTAGLKKQTTSAKPETLSGKLKKVKSQSNTNK